MMYRIPRQWKHSPGIQFEAIDATESLKLIEPIVAELGYRGQISFDFLSTDNGLTFAECNPRATDGLLLMPRAELAAGLLAPRPETFVLEAGSQVQLALAVLADGFADRLVVPTRSIPSRKDCTKSARGASASLTPSPRTSGRAAS
jgi:hypothetical protein